MQYDMGKFDPPLVDETQPKAQVWTDIGEAAVEHSVFGRAKVHVYRRKDGVRGALRWTLAAIGLIAGTVWLVSDATRQPAIVHVAPPKPVAESSQSEVQKPVRVAPAVKLQAASPVVTRRPQLQAPSAPVAARPALRAPVVVSAASAPVATAPAAVATRPAISVAAPVKPLAPAASPSEVSQAPVAAASAVRTGN